MKTVYEALNIVEAHMLADLLKQEGCSVQIQGEHLIGALGELPAAGLIRLTVDEAEYAAARAFILQWEAAQPKETPQMKPKSPISRIWFAAIGVLIGIAVTFLFFQLPYNSASFDHNNDNFADVSWIYSPGGRLVKFEADRNFDRKIDEYTEYDAHALPTVTWQDNDFNGTFETRTIFHNNAADRMLSDTDDDGFNDVMIVYLNGLTHSVEYVDPKTKSPWRIEYFRLGIFLTHADLDKNKDGRLESRQWYGRDGEIERLESIPH
ncbi:MAG: DUF2007 domain-containing protein [Burkholderiales bacterium]|nr:DUF2007 domain-containing protein [Burkholderiales bacterium]